MPDHGTMDPAVTMLLKEFVQDRLYGTIEVKFEAGRVILIRRTESIKPATQSEQPERG